MDVSYFNFPTLREDQANNVETTFCQLINAYRNGEPLTPEMVDYMDSANTWLESR